jgi:murein DD-endopeptidase MepM/ murein hydrolase activator NlpD
MSKYSKILFALTIFTLIFGFTAKRAYSHELVTKPAIFKLAPEMLEYPTNMSSVEAQIEQLNKQACPVHGRISSTFGYRNSPGGVGSTNHKGVDVAVPTGTNVFSVAEGFVVSVGYQGGYGNSVEIQHDGYSSFYAHNSKIVVKIGQHVKAGDVVALSGNTGGASTGPHSHVEKIVNNVQVNPIGFFESC